LAQYLTYRLHELTKLTDKVTDALFRTEAKLPLGEARCLAAVGAFQPLSVNQLAQHVNLDKGQASRAAQSLVDQGLLIKTPSAVDARGVVLRLSRSGQYRWRKVMALVDRRNAEVAQVLDEAERQQLDALLARLVAHARHQVDGGCDGSDVSGG
jgi:DNA-binding MarR family transcriptional regulator